MLLANIILEISKLPTAVTKIPRKSIYHQTSKIDPVARSHKEGASAKEDKLEASV